LVGDTSGVWLCVIVLLTEMGETPKVGGVSPWGVKKDQIRPFADGTVNAQIV
jgi:hypothetical protein